MHSIADMVCPAVLDGIDKPPSAGHVCGVNVSLMGCRVTMTRNLVVMIR